MKFKGYKTRETDSSVKTHKLSPTDAEALLAECGLTPEIQKIQVDAVQQLTEHAVDFLGKAVLDSKEDQCLLIPTEVGHIHYAMKAREDVPVISSGEDYDEDETETRYGTLEVTQRVTSPDFTKTNHDDWVAKIEALYDQD